MSRNDVTIRVATPADAPKVCEIVFACLRAYGIEPDPDGLDADLRTFGHGVAAGVAELVAQVEGRVVGLVVLAPRGEQHGWITKLFLDAGQRGRGIGRALLREATDEAVRRGYTQLGLRTRTAFVEAVRLYESAGWQRGADPVPAHGPDRTYTLDLRTVEHGIS